MRRYRFWSDVKKITYEWSKGGSSTSEFSDEKLGAVVSKHSFDDALAVIKEAALVEQSPLCQTFLKQFELVNKEENL